MKVNIEVVQSYPEKQTTFEEYADETHISIEDGPSLPHIEGNLVDLLSLLDRLYIQAREHIISQMAAVTVDRIPAIIYVPEAKVSDVTKVLGEK